MICPVYLTKEPYYEFNKKSELNFNAERNFSS